MTADVMTNTRQHKDSTLLNKSFIKQTAIVRRGTHNLFKIDKIISQVVNHDNDSTNKVIETIKTTSKQLAGFALIFLIYILLGALLFLYIEECSGAHVSNDPSTDYAKPKTIPIVFKDLNTTCWLLYKIALNSVKNCSNNTTIDDRYYVFYNNCLELVTTSVYPYVTNGKQRNCNFNQLQLLKYTGFTIFTLQTIGYGHDETTPLTNLGRSLLIIYSIFGIPIAVTMYKIAGKILVQLIHVCVEYINVKVYGGTKTKNIHLKVLMVSILMMISIMLLGSLVTIRSDMENWSFSTSFYFWFVSLTLIGYGDLTFDYKKQLESPHFMFLSFCNIIFGLAISSSIIQAFSMVIQRKKANIIVHNEDDIENKEELDQDLGRILLQLGLFSPDKTSE